MSLLVVLGAVLVLLILSGVYSGSETGIYSISRARVKAEARDGRPSARLLRRLLANDTGLLVTLLIGNNLMLELLIHVFRVELLPSHLPAGSREILVAVLLTPFVFLFGELLAKDLFRRRPHRFLTLAGPLLGATRVLVLPLALPLQGLSWLLERIFRLRGREVTRAFRRQEMLEFLREGARVGALEPRAEALARNVLVLRETPVSDVMEPWARVRWIDLSCSEKAMRVAVESSEFTRLPALSGAGGRVVGYVHQLDVMGGAGTVLENLRDLPRFDPDTPVDRALAQLRHSGQRLALVGSVDAPQGLATLMDLVGALTWERGQSIGDGERNIPSA